MQIKHVKINCHFIYQPVGILTKTHTPSQKKKKKEKKKKTKTHTLARFHTLISNFMFLLIYYVDFNVFNQKLRAVVYYSMLY